MGFPGLHATRSRGSTRDPRGRGDLRMLARRLDRLPLTGTPLPIPLSSLVAVGPNCLVMARVAPRPCPAYRPRHQGRGRKACCGRLRHRRERSMRLHLEPEGCDREGRGSLGLPALSARRCQGHVHYGMGQLAIESRCDYATDLTDRKPAGLRGWSSHQALRYRERLRRRLNLGASHHGTRALPGRSRR